MAHCQDAELTKAAKRLARPAITLARGQSPPQVEQYKIATTDARMFTLPCSPLSPREGEYFANIYS
jgi:hypothetical protein